MDAVECLRAKVHSLRWAHTIDLGHGIVTPGLWAPNPLILGALDRIDFRNKKVLDVGCWDGLWSFEAEKRGAREVIATDLVSQRPFAGQPTLPVARAALQSRVRYFPDISVYDVTNLGVRDFDVVLFCGVYYHLKNPLLAFARLREVMRPGGVLLVEGEVLCREKEPMARFFYRDQHCQDPTNWWVPSIPCLRQWVECSYFEIQKEPSPGREGSSLGDKGRRQPATAERAGLWGKVKGLARVVWRRPALPLFARHLFLARAVCRRDQGYYFPDEDLRGFDVEKPGQD